MFEMLQRGSQSGLGLEVVEPRRIGVTPCGEADM